MDRHGDERAGFRFGYMSQRQEEHQLPRTTLQKLATRLTAPGPGTRDSDVPAGYTYLGQFIAHDLSFDLTTAGLGRRLSLRRLQQAASPSLDLDSLYGAGPMDPDSARFYVGREGPCMITGRTEAAGGHPAFEGCDLPRGADGEPRKALIPDPRNDDNLAVAQTHAAMMRFHNRVARRADHRGRPAHPLRAGARHRHAALPVDRLARLPAADLRPRRARRRAGERPQGVRARSRPRRPLGDAARVLDRGLPPRALHGPERLRLEPQRDDALDRATCSGSRAGAATSAGATRFRARAPWTSGASTTSRRPAADDPDPPRSTTRAGSTRG